MIFIWFLNIIQSGEFCMFAPVFFGLEICETSPIGLSINTIVWLTA